MRIRKLNDQWFARSRISAFAILDQLASIRKAAVGDNVTTVKFQPIAVIHNLQRACVEWTVVGISCQVAHMPVISVFVDGTVIATVCTDGYDVLNVRAGGNRVDGEFATLDVSGGSYPEHGESVYLTWVNSSPLKPGQVIRVSMQESGATSHPGKTIEELFPEEQLKPASEIKPLPEIFKELRMLRPLRDRYVFRFTSISGTSVSGQTRPEDHSFGFSVVWSSHRPERASVSIYSATLEEVEHRRLSNDYVKEHLQPGQEVTLTIDE